MRWEFWFGFDDGCCSGGIFGEGDQANRIASRALGEHWVATFEAKDFEEAKCMKELLMKYELAKVRKLDNTRKRKKKPCRTTGSSSRK